MTQILLKRSATSGSAPTSLAQGELAINIADAILFWADASGTVRATPPLNTLVTQSQLNGLVAGAPSALDTLKELADAIGDDANFASTVTTALGNRLRFDQSQSLSATQGAQARYNLGRSAPLTTTASFTVDANLGLDRAVYFNGAHTATLPTGVFAGWMSGEFHNLLATSVGTIVPPSGTIVSGGASVASVAVAYGQKVKFLYDGTNWRAVWVDRQPILALVDFSKTPTASVDFPLPVGVKLVDFRFSRIINTGLAGFRFAYDTVPTFDATTANYQIYNFYSNISASSNGQQYSTASLAYIGEGSIAVLGSGIGEIGYNSAGENNTVEVFAPNHTQGSSYAYTGIMRAVHNGHGTSAPTFARLLSDNGANFTSGVFIAQVKG